MYTTVRKCLLIFAVFHIGCAEEEYTSSRTSREGVLDTVQSRRTAADSADAMRNGSNETNKDDSSQNFGEGMSEIQFASTLPRCGIKYEAVYAGLNRQSFEFSEKLSFTALIKSMFKLSGDSKNATLDLSSDISQIIAIKGVTEKQIQSELSRTTGHREYVFHSGDSYKKLQANETQWRKIECAILAVDTLRYQNALFKFEPALPALVSPRASREVYISDIENGLSFKKIKSYQLGSFRKGESSTQEEFIEKSLPESTSILLDVDINIIEKNSESLTIEFKIKQSEESSMKSEWELLSRGLFPRMKLKIDTTLRQSGEILTKVPFKGPSTDQYEYSLENKLVKQ